MDSSVSDVRASFDASANAVGVGEEGRVWRGGLTFELVQYTLITLLEEEVVKLAASVGGGLHAGTWSPTRFFAHQVFENGSDAQGIFPNLGYEWDLGIFQERAQPFIGAGNGKSGSGRSLSYGTTSS